MAKNVSIFGSPDIEKQSRKRKKMIWRAVAYYWNVYLKERFYIKKSYPDAQDFEVIQRAVLSLFGKDGVEALNALLELGIPYHPFNTLIYKAVNHAIPLKKERIHGFCLGCILLGDEYREALRELIKEGIVEKTWDREWLDYLRRWGGYIPELESR